MIHGRIIVAALAAALTVAAGAEEIQDYGLGPKKSHAVSEHKESAPARTIVDVDPSSDIGQLVRQAHEELALSQKERTEAKERAEVLDRQLGAVKKELAAVTSKNKVLIKKVGALHHQVRILKQQKAAAQKEAQAAAATGASSEASSATPPAEGAKEGNGGRTSAAGGDSVDLFAECPPETGAKEKGSKEAAPAPKRGTKEAPAKHE